MFMVYMNNKPKTDSRFTFNGIVRLTEPCPSLVCIIFMPFLGMFTVCFCLSKRKRKKKKKEETGYSGIGKMSVAEMKN